MWLTLQLALLSIAGAAYCRPTHADACVGRSLSLDWYGGEFHDPFFGTASPFHYGNPLFPLNKATFMHLVDLDLDGLIDVVNVDNGNVTFAKRLQNLSLAQPYVLVDIGAVTESWNFRGFKWISQIQSADWDGDGDVDLFVFNYDGKGHAMYLEQIAGHVAASPMLFKNHVDVQGFFEYDLRVSRPHFRRLLLVAHDMSLGNLCFYLCSLCIFILDFPCGIRGEEGESKLMFIARSRGGNPVAGVETEGPVQMIDWDQDGDPDIVLSEGTWHEGVYSGQNVGVKPEFVILENMGGTLHRRVGSHNPLDGFTSLFRVQSLTAGDWDGDGDADLLVWEVVKRGRQMYKGQLAYYEQLQGGSIIRRQLLWGPTAFYYIHTALQIADWDADGLPDVRIGPFLLKSSLAEEFSEWGDVSPLEKLGLSNTGVAFVDWDGNGLMDVLDGGKSDTSLLYFQSQPDGTFILPAYEIPCVSLHNSTGIAAGDWDGDGDVDFLVCDATGLRYYERLHDDIRALTERTGWENPFQNVSTEHIKQCFVVDWNADGLADLLLTTTDGFDHGRNLAFWEQQSNGSLAERMPIVGRGIGTFFGISSRIWVNRCSLGS